MLNTKNCRDRLMDAARRLLAVDSPSGFTHNAVETAEHMARLAGYETRRTNKGNLIIDVPGREGGKKIGLCAHIDTLGLMVRSLTGDGMLKITRWAAPSCPPWTGSTAGSTPGAGRCIPAPSSPSPPPSTSLKTPPPVPGRRRSWRCASTRR